MFVQLNRDMRRSQTGLGIGLTLVKQMTEMHGGSVAVWSAGAGQGSEFTITLPLAVTVGDRARPRGSAEPVQRASRSRSSSPTTARTAPTAWRSCSRPPVTKSSPPTTAAPPSNSPNDHRPDAVLLDIGMPEVSGYDVARAIRREAWGRSMRLIALTGWGQAEHRRRSIEVGFDDHLVKPVELDRARKRSAVRHPSTHFRQGPADQLSRSANPVCGTSFVVALAMRAQAHGRNGLAMSARTWLIAGLLATAMRCPPQLNNRTHQEDPRGRVATTIDGDAGLWWLPVADTNGKKMSRGSVERNSRNTPQGLMNVATFTANVSYGFTDRFDVYAGWDFITRVDRDNQVLFVPADPERGGVDTEVPYARERWTGNKIGDLRVGAKYAFLSEGQGDPFSFAGRATINLPTGDADQGAGQGSVAADVSGVISRWVTNKFVFTGTAGYNFRKNPSDPVIVHVPNNFHWGAGVGINPTPSWLIHGEILGDNPVRDNAAIDQPLIAEDGSLSPAVSFVDHQASFTGGVTWFANNGFFIGAEVRLDTPMPDRINASEDSRSDYLDYHVRIGWSPRRTPAAATARDAAAADAACAHRAIVRRRSRRCAIRARCMSARCRSCSADAQRSGWRSADLSLERRRPARFDNPAIVQARRGPRR